MMTRFSCDVVVFDLDDTLYKETLFVASGFKAVADYVGDVSFAAELDSWRAEGKNAFECLIGKYSLRGSVDELLSVYRNHLPEIELDASTALALDCLAAKGKTLGIITDGRSRTQRNKIQALGLSRWFSDDNIIISEEFGSSKPDERNYRFFMDKYPHKTYAYIGDNVTKDFIAPKILGWRTICLKNNGQNIHSQNFDVEDEFLPDATIVNILETNDLI